MKSVFKLAVMGTATLWLFCPNGKVLAQQIKRVGPISKSVFAFRPIHPTGSRRNVVVEVRGHKVHDDFHQDRIDSLEIVLLSVRNGQRKILSETRLEDDLFWCDASLYRHRRSGDYLLAIEATGGQHDHTLVYYIDPQRLRVRPLFDERGVIYGDPSGLPGGHLIEYCPEQYIAPDEKPIGFKRGDTYKTIYLQRSWTYQARTHHFVASRYRREQ